MANKVKYGIKNVHYAIATISTDGTATYATPVPFPGAVSLSMEPQGENTPFYADNVEYWTGVGNTGYEGDLEMAMISESFETDVLGMIADSVNVVYEDLNAQAVHFALLWQFEGDEKATRHVMYNCTAQRPNVSGSTVEESIEPQTETITIRATSVHVNSVDKDVVKAKTKSTTTTATYNGWFNTVHMPTT